MHPLNIWITQSDEYQTIRSLWHLSGDARAALEGKADGDDQKLLSLLQLETEALHFVFANSWDRNAPDREIGPVIESEDGSCWPDVSRLSRSDLSYLADRAESTHNQQLRAIYSEILWHRRHGHENARKAFEAHLSAANLGWDEDGFAYLFHLCRPLVIARRLRNADLQVRAEAEISLHLRQLVNNQQYRWIFEIADTAIRFRKSLNQSLLKVARVALRIAMWNYRRENNEHLVQGSLARLRQLGPVSGVEQTALTKWCLVRTADSFLREALIAGDNGDEGLVASHTSKALQVLRTAGLPRNHPVARRLQVEIVSRNVNSGASAQSFEISIPMSYDDLDDWLRLTENLSPPDLCTALTFQNSFPPLAQAIAEVGQECLDYPLQHLFPIQLLHADGRVLFVGDTDERKTQYWVGKKFELWMGITAIRIHYLLSNLRQQGRLEANVVVDQIRNCAFADGYSINAIGAAIDQIWSGAFTLPIRVLVIEFEGVLRNALRLLGEPITVTNADQTIDYKHLDQILSEPKLASVLGLDLGYRIRHLLTSPFGLQLRHAVAHAYLDDKLCSPLVADLLVFHLLQLTRFVRATPEDVQENHKSSS